MGYHVDTLYPVCEIVAPLSVTLVAEIKDHPCVNSVELTIGAPDACVGVGVIVGVEVAVGVGVFVLGAFNVLASAKPPTLLNANTSTSMIVKMMNKPFCFRMGFSFLSFGCNDRCDCK